MSVAASDYFRALMSTKIITFVGVVEVAAGLALILNKYGALMSIILMSVSISIVLFHATLDQANITTSLAVLVIIL